MLQQEVNLFIGKAGMELFRNLLMLSSCAEIMAKGGEMHDLTRELQAERNPA